MQEKILAPERKSVADDAAKLGKAIPDAKVVEVTGTFSDKEFKQETKVLVEAMTGCFSKLQAGFAEVLDASFACEGEAFFKLLSLLAEPTVLTGVAADLDVEACEAFRSKFLVFVQNKAQHAVRKLCSSMPFVQQINCMKSLSKDHKGFFGSN